MHTRSVVTIAVVYLAEFSIFLFVNWRCFLGTYIRIWTSNLWA